MSEDAQTFCKRLMTAVIRIAMKEGNLVPTKYFGGNQSGRDNR
ncbi:hypothetical protein B0G75_1409 [Paraburkholderia sp. BL18I3N2]|nr:hypothetical protein B0G75_1409 [Paraburkholderia sp. BL18I3N2]